MNSHQRRKYRRQFISTLPGNIIRMAKFRRQLCGAVRIPMRRVFSNCDLKGFIKNG